MTCTPTCRRKPSGPGVRSQPAPLRAFKPCLRAAAPCQLLAHGVTGSASFHSLGPHKIELIHHTLQWGLELVITDVDALVLREPFEYMVRRSDGALPDARSPAHARA